MSFGPRCRTRGSAVCLLQEIGAPTPAPPLRSGGGEIRERRAFGRDDLQLVCTCAEVTQPEAPVGGRRAARGCAQRTDANAAERRAVGGEHRACNGADAGRVLWGRECKKNSEQNGHPGLNPVHGSDIAPSLREFSFQSR